MKSKKAFTLIELLVVIAIIGILATIVFINVTNTRAKAARAKVESDMETVNKIAIICKTYGGGLFDSNFGGPEGIPQGGVTEICAGKAGNAEERAMQAGVYPVLPNGYSYDHSLGGEPAVVRHGSASLTCDGVSRCNKSANWDTTDNPNTN